MDEEADKKEGYIELFIDEYGGIRYVLCLIRLHMIMWK